MQNIKFKKLLLIDLDGVLNQYDGKFDKNFIPPIRQGAKNFIEKLFENFELKLFTTRDKSLANKWLNDNELNKYFTEITNIKILCYLFIDDRCIVFKGDYQKTIQEILNYKVWFK